MKNNKKIAALLLSLILAFSIALPVFASEEFDSTTSSNKNVAPPTVSFSAPQEETYTPTPEIQYTPDRDLDKDTNKDNLTVFTKDKSKAESDTATTISDKKDVAPPTVTVSEKPKSDSENNTSSNNSNGTNVSGVQGTENNKPEPEDGTVTRSGTGTTIEYETKMSLPETKPEEPVSKPPVQSIFNEGEKLTDVNKTVKTTTGTVEVSGISVDDRAAEAIELVNKERIAAGLKPLTYDPRLADATLLRALESSVYWSHTRPDESQWYTVSGLVNGENLAKGYKTAEEVMVGWMNSQGHRENILRSNFTRICIVCVKTDNGWFWVQLFGV